MISVDLILSHCERTHDRHWHPVTAHHKVSREVEGHVSWKAGLWGGHLQQEGGGKELLQSFSLHKPHTDACQTAANKFHFYFVLWFQNIFTPVEKKADRWDFLQQNSPFTTSFNTSLNWIVHFFTTVSGNSKGTLTVTVLRTESDAVGVMAFTEMGISPRTSSLMGMWMDAPPWLSTYTRLTMGTVRPPWSGKTKWNASLSATITVTWQQRQWKSTHITWDASFPHKDGRGEHKS